jgi:hypothetical protein
MRDGSGWVLDLRLQFVDGCLVFFHALQILGDIGEIVDGFV